MSKSAALLWRQGLSRILDCSTVLNMMTYPGFWLALSTVTAGGLCALMALQAIRDKDWLGSALLVALSLTIMVYFFA